MSGSTSRAAFARLRQWLHVLARFTTLQTVCYAANLTAGVLLVRLLPPRELALFTIGFAAFTVANVIADGGATGAFMSLGALAVGDPGQLWQLRAAVVRCRAYLAAPALLIALGLLIVPLARLQYDAGTVVVAAALCVAYLYGSVQQLAGTVLLRLHLRYHELQLVDLGGGLVRLALIVLVVRVRPSGLVALGITSALSLVQAVAVARMAARYVARCSGPPTYVQRVADVLRDALPGVVFFALQGQITVALLGAVGSDQAIAGAGALSRVAVVFAVLAPAVANVIAPKFARLPAERAHRVYGQVVAAASLIAVTLVAALDLGSRPILSMFGAPYARLHAELLLAAGTAAVAFVAGVAGELNKVRAWLQQSWLVIPAVLGAQIIAVRAVKLTSLRGALLFGLISAVPPLVVSLYQAWIGSRRSIAMRHEPCVRLGSDAVTHPSIA